MKLYVWDNVLECDHQGLAVAYANTLQEAVDLILKEATDKFDAFVISILKQDLTKVTPMIYDNQSTARIREGACD